MSKLITSYYLTVRRDRDSNLQIFNSQQFSRLLQLFNNNLQNNTIVLPMCYLKTKKADLKSQLSHIVQAERLELSHLAALDPKSSVSTNSTTPAFVEVYKLTYNM